MEFWSPVARRTRSQRGKAGTFSDCRAVEKKKGGSFPLKSKVKEPFKNRKSRNCTSVGNRGKFPHLAQSPRGASVDEIIRIEESGSDSAIDVEYSLDESDNGLEVQSRRDGSCDQNVRAEQDRTIPDGFAGDADSVISIGSSSSSDEDGPCEDGEERLPDTESGSEEFETSSESDTDEGEDEDFSPSGDQRSVESQEEEEEEEETEESNHWIEKPSKQCKGEKRGVQSTEPKGLHADGLLLSHKVEPDMSDEKVIHIGSSDDDTDDSFGMSGGLEIAGGVASRTRSRLGQRESKRGTMGQASFLSSEGESTKKCNPSSTQRKKAQKGNWRGVERKQQSDNSRGSDHATMKNGTESDSNMLSSHMGYRVKHKMATDIVKSENADDGNDEKCNPFSPPRKKARKRNWKGVERKQQSDKSRGSDHATLKSGTESDSNMLSSHMGCREKHKTATDIVKSENPDDGNDENSKSGSSDQASNSVMVEKRVTNRSTRKSDFFKILADSILLKNDKVQDEVLKEQQQVMELRHLILPWLVEEKPAEKSKSEDELDELWCEMNFGLQADKIGSFSYRNEDQDIDSSELGTSQADLCRRGKHVLFLDDEIGERCRHCSYIEAEIRDLCPPMEKLPSQTPYRSYHSYQGSASLDGLQAGPDENRPADCFSSDLSGTVWDLVPEAKNQMYPHQQEGFEFMWRNLGGSISLDDLRGCYLQKQDDIGGCIISHAPGTGKTRLTLVFLQSYLELYPDSRPAIIAPAGLLLTWEGEFRKWGVEVPFHNLNTELSGKEDSMALRMLESHRLSRNTNSIRMVKLYSWCKKKSILVVSYDLFVKLTGEGSRSTKETEHMREILLKQPGLVILDEGHIPRNRESQVWNLIIKLETKKRVILSGTPFQNNFEELLNTLHLVRPKIAESIPLSLKKFCQRGPTVQIDGDPVKAIDKIKEIMAPFVHLHKGSILQKSLPGLRDCVVVLNPNELQLEILRSLHGSENGSEDVGRKRKERNVFDFEHKQALISLHPSLAMNIKFSPEEDRLKSLIFREEDRLKAHELNPSKGVKTWFLKEFLQLCLVMGEKVLVFSQYITPLEFIEMQLGKAFGWTKGVEILLMIGDNRMSQRQSMINLFNDPHSQARVLLASTKACSEGINLVGASRVILLDVVWNPAVERQAISRAYRLGQKRVVYTYHLIMKGTSEWDKYQKQVHKDRLSELVFSATTSDGENSGKKLSSVSEDKILEEMTSHPKLRGIFDQIRYQPKCRDLV